MSALLAKASASGAEDPGFESRLRRDFSGSSHTSDLTIGTPVATLSGAWRYRVSAGPNGPGVRILWLGEVESLICNFCLSVAARKIVWAVPSLRYTCLLLGQKAANQQTNCSVSVSVLQLYRPSLTHASSLQGRYTIKDTRQCRHRQLTCPSSCGLFRCTRTNWSLRVRGWFAKLQAHEVEITIYASECETPLQFFHDYEF